MIPIVVCTIGSKSVEVLKRSVEVYAPENKLIVNEVDRSSFGESYNTALEKAFKEYDEVIVSNDDVVLTPTTIQILLSDVQKLKTAVDKIGFVATMADNVRMSQNIRLKFLDDDQIMYGRWKSEQLIKQVPVIAPIFAWYSKKAFEVAKFPPITWYSDDIICEDLNRAGYKNFVSTAYIHHVGSSTIGVDYHKLRDEAMPWIAKNRPEYLQELNRRLYGV